MRIGDRPQHGPDVLETFAADAAPNGFDHLPLDIFRVDEAVGTDAARELDGEPSRARADVGDLRAVGGAERVHDLIRLLPCGAVGAFEKAEVLGREKMPGALLGAGAGLKTRPYTDKRQDTHDERPPHHFAFSRPGMPGVVISST